MQRPRQQAAANSNQIKPYFWLKMAVVIIPQEFTTALAIVVAFRNYEIAFLAYIQRSEIILVFLFGFELDL